MTGPPDPEETDAALERRRAQAARIRARGRRRFVLRAGVLGFGGLWTLLIALLCSFFVPLHARFPALEPPGLRLLAWIALVLPVGIAAGKLWGDAMWTHFEAESWFLPREDGEESEDPEEDDSDDLAD